MKLFTVLIIGLFLASPFAGRAEPPLSAPMAVCGRLYGAFNFPKQPPIRNGKAAVVVPAWQPATKRYYGYWKLFEKPDPNLDASLLGEGTFGNVYRMRPKNGDPAFVRKYYVGAEELLEEDMALMEIWRALAEKLDHSGKSSLRVARVKEINSKLRYVDMENIEGTDLISLLEPKMRNKKWIKGWNEDFLALGRALALEAEKLTTKEIEEILKAAGMNWKVKSKKVDFSGKLANDPQYFILGFEFVDSQGKLRDIFLSSNPRNLVLDKKKNLVVIDPR